MDTVLKIGGLIKVCLLSGIPLGHSAPGILGTTFITISSPSRTLEDFYVVKVTKTRENRVTDTDHWGPQYNSPASSHHSEVHQFTSTFSHTYLFGVLFLDINK